ncbi:lipid-A-disaccharide synthase [Halorhodospira abdelmalekii]|uniref:lipid-A-disaccharide synthase n=1 Tax=Halorhodospira abdelmalekii TaxID=421629 RepID=UPI00308445AA
MSSTERAAGAGGAAAAEWRIALLAGEPSGDVLGGALMRALQEQCPGLSFEGVGGAQMQAAGLQPVAPMDGLALVGLSEIVRHLPRLLRLRRALVERWRNAPPDLFIGIDLPDFNLSLEQRLRAAGVPTVHYVSPTVWAWRRGRIRTIERAVDRMLTLYPFEQRLYATSGVDAVCVGHPAADRLPLHPERAQTRARLQIPAQATVLALLPGSRDSEIERLLPPFAETAAQLAAQRPGLHVVVPVALASWRTPIFEALLSAGVAQERLHLLDGDVAAAASAADVALVASGTATLEVMLAKCPMVVAYRVSPLTFQLVKRMIQVPWVSLPNLLAQEALVPEFFQEQVDAPRLSAALDYWLDDTAARSALLSRFSQLHQELSGGAAAGAAASAEGGAERRAAAAVLELLP